MKPPARSSAVSPQCDTVRFYEGDGPLARLVAEFLIEGFDAGSPGIVIATADQRTAVIQQLADRAIDVDALLRARRLLLLDATEMLSAFMANGCPDPRRFRIRMTEAIAEACRVQPDCTVRLFGQMVDVLWQQGRQDAAIRLEVLWNQLPRNAACPVVSAYSVGHFYKDADTLEGPGTWQS
jgi:hypothetical protein